MNKWVDVWDRLCRVVVFYVGGILGVDKWVDVWDRLCRVVVVGCWWDTWDE